jgi:hypothetical protein
MVCRMVDQGLNPQAASDAPRWRVLDDNHGLTVEWNMPQAVIEGLVSRGHPVKRCAYAVIAQHKSILHAMLATLAHSLPKPPHPTYQPGKSMSETLEQIPDLGGPAQPLLSVQGLIKHFPLKGGLFGRSPGSQRLAGRLQFLAMERRQVRAGDGYGGQRNGSGRAAGVLPRRA